MKKMLILLLCLPFCLCACQAEPETPPSGVLLADYWSEIPEFVTLEHIQATLPPPPNEAFDEIFPAVYQAENYQEYEQQILPRLPEKQPKVTWEEIAALGTVQKVVLSDGVLSYYVSLIADNGSNLLSISVGGSCYLIEEYYYVYFENTFRELYGKRPKALPVKWTEITAIDTQNPLHLPEQMQAPLIEGQEKRYSYYKTPAGFILFYHDGRLAGISGFHAEEEVYFSIPETDAETVQDIPFTSLRRLIELATRTV